MGKGYNHIPVKSVWSGLGMGFPSAKKPTSPIKVWKLVLIPRPGYTGVTSTKGK